MKIKGAIFDMDGTLLDSLGGWDVLWEWCGERFLGVSGYKPDVEVDKAVRTMVLIDAMDYIHDHYGFGENGRELFDYLNGILPELYTEKFDFKPGAREFLDYCYTNGIKMCLASATETKYIDIALDRHGMRKYFTRVLSCAEIGRGKEFPDIYLAALEALGTDASETWVFEDSYVALETAAGIGLPTVGIFDRNNFEQERLKGSATHYIAEGETLMKLVPFEC